MPSQKKPVKCVHFGSSAEFYNKSYHRVTWLSLFPGLFSMPCDLPHKISACANLVSNSIQTTTLFIICTQDFEDDFYQVRVQISELSTEWQWDFPPKKDNC